MLSPSPLVPFTFLSLGLLPTLTFSQQLLPSDVLSTPYSVILSSSGHVYNTPLLSNGTLDRQAWSNVTSTACVSVLSKLPRATNPSGTALCFNLPMLDTSSGHFDADLVIYTISAQRAEWKDANMGYTSVDITFEHADVKVKNTTTTTNDDMGKSGTTLPQPWRTYVLSGKIKPDKFSSDMSIADLQPLLLPKVILSSSSSPLYTSPSTNEATFLTGVFSESTFQSDFASARGAVEHVKDEIRSGDVALAMPGTQVLILPIGLIITGVWTALGLAAVGWGTWERLMHRSNYKSGRRQNYDRRSYEMTAR